MFVHLTTKIVSRVGMSGVTTINIGVSFTKTMYLCPHLFKCTVHQCQCCVQCNQIVFPLTLT